MNHQHYKEWLQLSMYDELNADEKASLDHHLLQCSECQRELEELQQFHTALTQAGSFEPDENLLREARQELHVALRTVHMRPSLGNRISDYVSDLILPHYKVALGGMAMMAIGVLVGRLLFSAGQLAAVQTPEKENFTSSFTDEPRISNIRFIDSDASDGNVEFTFESTSPVHVKGNINDDRVQKVLAHALVNDQNPGVRLRSVNAFAANVQSLKLPDKEIKAALLLALKTDANPGVRREALKTLKSFPFDEEVKQAFLYVLMRDTNPALRIAAINSLDSARVQGQQTDKDLMSVLKQKMQSDENNYVRIRARAVLEEVKQQ